MKICKICGKLYPDVIEECPGCVANAEYLEQYYERKPEMRPADPDPVDDE